MRRFVNFNHLYYFWIVAREGGVIRASEELHVSQPTISNQIKELEESLGHKLFARAGRGLALTEQGKIAFNHANEMFAIGQEMLRALERQPIEQRLRLAIGVLDVIPKVVAFKLLTPTLELSPPVRIVCREDKSDRLLADLAARRTDVVLSDAPIATAFQLAGFSHLLGDSGITFFAAEKLARRTKGTFPKCLDGMPMLLPSDHTEVRRVINQWLDSKRIHPVINGEFDDSAMLLRFGREGTGIFPALSIVEDELLKELKVKVIGRVASARVRLYAITREEKPQHPAVIAICRQKARE